MKTTRIFRIGSTVAVLLAAVSCTQTQSNSKLGEIQKSIFGSTNMTSLEDDLVTAVFSGSGAENWNAETVDIGTNYYFTALGPFTDYSRWYSFDPVIPSNSIWQTDEDIVHPEEPITLRHRVAASKNEGTSLSVTLFDRDFNDPFNSRRVVVRGYDTENIGPATQPFMWEYISPIVTNGHEQTYPFVSQDGQKVIIVIHDIFEASANVTRLNPQNGNVMFSKNISLITPLTRSHMSPNGKYVYLGSNFKHTIIDTDDVVQNAPFYDVFIVGGIPIASGVTNNGDFASAFIGKVQIFKRSGSNYTRHDYELEAEDPLEPFNPSPNLTPSQLAAAQAAYDFQQESFCSAMALTDDTLVCGFSYFNYGDNEKFKVRAINTNTFATLLDSNEFNNIPGFQNIPQQIAISNDGQRFGVASWGDNSSSGNEVFIYEIGANPQGLGDRPIAAYNLSGSANKIKADPLGEKFVVASKATHANVTASGGAFHLFEKPRDILPPQPPTPLAITGFSASQDLENVIQLDWDDTLDPNYPDRTVQLFRSSLSFISGCSGSPIQSFPFQNGFTDPVGPDQTYYYSARIMVPNGELSDCTEVVMGHSIATPVEVVPPPNFIRAVMNQSVRWILVGIGNAPTAVSFNLFSSLNDQLCQVSAPTDRMISIPAVGGLIRYQDEHDPDDPTTVQPGNDYYYSVQAVSTSGEVSECVGTSIGSLKIPTPQPPQPQGCPDGSTTLEDGACEINLATLAVANGFNTTRQYFKEGNSWASTQGASSADGVFSSSIIVRAEQQSSGFSRINRSALRIDMSVIPESAQLTSAELLLTPLALPSNSENKIVITLSSINVVSGSGVVLDPTPADYGLIPGPILSNEVSSGSMNIGQERVIPLDPQMLSGQDALALGILARRDALNLNLLGLEGFFNFDKDAAAVRVRFTMP